MDRIMDPPLFSDTATQIQSFSQLFAVHAAERKKIEERQQTVAKARFGPERLSEGASVSDEVEATKGSDDNGKLQADQVSVTERQDEANHSEASGNALSEGGGAAEAAQSERPETLNDGQRRAAYLEACHAAILTWAKENAGQDERKGA